MIESPLCHAFSKRSRRAAWRLIAAVLVCLPVILAGRSEADESAAEAKSPQQPSRAYQLQPGDNPADPLEPLKKRTPEEQRELDAVAWYMTGNFHASRGEFKQAMEAFQKAVELDPDAVAAYQALVPLAFSANRADEAIDYATKAFRLDPANHRLLRLLAAHMIRQNKLGDAIELLEKSLNEKPLPRESLANVNLRWDLARYYRAAGKNDEAAESFEVVFEAALDPKRFHIDERTQAALQADKNYEAIGEAFLDAKRTELAIRAFQQVSDARNGRPGLLNLHLSKAYRQTGRYEEALKELGTFFGTQIPRRDAYELLAELLKEQGQSDQLIDRLEELAQDDTRNSVLKYFLAEQYVAAKRYEDAEKLYQSSLDGSSDPAGYVGLASVYRQQGRADDWLNTVSKPFEKAVSDATGDLPEVLVGEMREATQDVSFLEKVVAAGKAKADGDPPTLSFATAYLLGKLSAEVEDKEATEKFYRFAITSRGGNSMLLYDELSRWLLVHDHFGDAAAVLQDAVDDPALAAQRPTFLYFLARAREFNGETKAALAANEEARRARPEVAEFHFQRAWIYYHSRQWDAAIAAMEKVMTDFPENKSLVRQCQFSISNIHVQRGDIRKGEEILEQVLAEDPDDPSVNNDLGYLYADQGKNLEQAEKMIRKALQAEPENAAYLDSMGWVLYKLGRAEEAIPYLEKAVEQPSGADPTILDHLGDCYDRLGQAEKAREAWERALEKGRAESRPDAKLLETISSKLETSKKSRTTE